MDEEDQSTTTQQPSEASLQAEYADVNDNIRELTGIRFQLLAFLPVGTVLGAFLLTADDVSFRPVLALFGLAVTIGLLIYHERNDQIYGELISRAKQIEQSLHLHDGQYNERIGAWQSLKLMRGTPEVKINHSSGINTIYAVSLVAWVYAILFEVLNWIADLVAGAIVPDAPTNQALRADVRALATVLIALVLSVTIIWLAKRTLAAQQEARENQMRKDAKKAVAGLSELRVPVTPEENEKWQDSYDYLLRVKEGTGPSNEQSEEAGTKIRNRADYYLTSVASAAPPFKRQSDGKLGAQNACFLASRLTDIPARWYMDVYTRRRT